MKKFKLFAIVAMLGLSINAMATKVEYANTVFRYTYDPAATPVVATIIGFVDGADVAALEIPSVVNMNDAGKTEIPVVAVGSTDGTFAGNEVVTSLTIPAANVATIYTAAFANCKNLATVTFAERGEDDPVLAIQAGAFEGTAITELDLTNTKMATLNQLFTSGTNKNKKLSSIKLPKTLGTIGANAFKNCLLLETIDFSKCTTDLTIEANFLEGTIFLEEIELPDCVVAIQKDALAESSITKLTINSYTGTGNKPTIGQSTGGIGGADLKEIIVKGAFKGKFGDGTQPVSATFTTLTFKGAVGDGATAAILAEAATGASLKTVTFEGEVKAAAIAGSSFYKATKLATVEFKGNLAEGAVASGAFGDGTYHAGSGLDAGKFLTVKYNPTEAAATKVPSFNQAAFQTKTNKDTKVAILATATWYKAWILANQADDATPTPNKGLYGVDLQAAAATKSIAVDNNGEGKYYYGSLIADGKYKIAASQNGGKVMVYGAYIDQVKSGSTVTNTAYMDQLHIIGGYYYIPSGENVVIKSTVKKEVLVEAAESATENSAHYVQAGTTSLNQIKKTTEELLGQELMNQYNPWATGAGADNKNHDVYFLAPFDQYGLLWSKFKATRTLPEGTLYLVAPASSAARLNVVWLDGSEEDATAIQTVKKANAENGAIYNLAGQKVSASYKGVVIKDGKKYIQK